MSKHTVFALCLLIIPPAWQKGPPNSCWVHDGSAVVDSSLAARPGAEKLRLQQRQEEAPMGPRETEEALCVPSPSAAVKQFYSLLLTCFVWVLFFMVHIFFLKQQLPSSLLSFISKQEKLISPQLGFHRTRLSFRAPPPTQNRHISQSNFQNNSLTLFPSTRNIGLYLSCFNREQCLIGDKIHRQIWLFYVQRSPGTKAEALDGAQQVGSYPSLSSTGCEQINYASGMILSKLRSRRRAGDLPCPCGGGGPTGVKFKMGCSPLGRVQSTFSLVWGF